MTDTDEELRQQCRDMADTLNALASGQYYDTETGEFVDIIPDDEEDRYQSLEEYVLDDNLGIKIIIDIDGNCFYGAEICVAWGGPNIYINTRTSYVEGYWGCTEVKEPFSYTASDEINNYIEELRGCY